MDENAEMTPKAQTPHPDAVNQTTLTPLVQSALNSETVQVTDWDYEQLHAGVGAGTAVYRFSGEGRDQDQRMSWSLILKALQPEGGSADVSAWNYYKREMDAYQSGWFDDLPGSLAAPRDFDVVEHADGTCWMWLEDITDVFGSRWSLEHYGVVARHLGRFNGAYLTKRPHPDWPWLSSDWLRHYIAQSAPAIEPLRESLTHPLVRRWFPGDDSDEFFRLWTERDLYLDTLDRLPQTICHFDAFRRNLFARRTADGDDQTVVIDWAFVGRGPIGADLSPLVLASIALYEVGLDKVQELDRIVFDGYMEGLRNTGWSGDPRQARMGYILANLRYTFGAIGPLLKVILDESLHARAEQAFGHPLGEVLDYFAQMRRPFGKLLDEARELMDILG